MGRTTVDQGDSGSNHPEGTFIQKNFQAPVVSFSPEKGLRLDNKTNSGLFLGEVPIIRSELALFSQSWPFYWC